MHMMKADVMVDIHARNNHIAEHVHEHLAEHKIFAVNIMGAPGAGKTTTLENLLKHLDVPGYVIEGDIESNIDTERLRKQNIAATQINTFGACHLDAPLVHNAIHALPFDKPGILFIENVGNLVCPAEFSIGEDIKLLQVSVTDGSDKPYKYPLAFDEEFFMKGIRHLNKTAPVFKVSGKTGEGYAEAAAWLKQRAGF